MLGQFLKRTTATACARTRWRRALVTHSKLPGGGKQTWVALWGNGDHGRLGLRSVDSSWKPTVCRALQDRRPSSVACGGAHTLILTADGAVLATGLNDCGQLGVSLDVPFSDVPVKVEGLPDACVSVAAGHHHSAAISEAGDVYVWGSNSQGQLGLGKNSPLSACKAQRIETLKGYPIKALAFGAEHSLALTAEGALLSWGAGQSGQLGHGNEELSLISRLFRSRSVHSPKLVKTLGDRKLVRIAAGLMHSACIDEHGVLHTFGQGRFSQLGLGEDKDTAAPSTVMVSPSVAEVACGGYHTGAVSRNGDLYMWGSNEYGCLGLGYNSHSRYPTRVRSELAKLTVTSVSCGWKHSAALTDDGQIFTWGWGGSQGTYAATGRSSGGQLGHENEFDYLEPTVVKFGALGSIIGIQISCGFNHTGAVLEER